MAQTSQKPYIYDVSEEALQTWAQAHAQPAYRIRQLRAWLHRGMQSVEDLTDLPKSLREALAEDFTFDGLRVETRLQSRQDGTTKYVFSLADGHRVETVWMHYEASSSVCLSTQSGCRMGCSFCASTGVGFGRNLTAGELYAQVALVGRLQETRISHVVLMGIGEPLENYDEVLRFIRQLNDPKGLNISLRHVSLSTCGLVPEIYRLAQEDLPVTLAISLHAPNDALRARLMPIAKRYPLQELMGAVRHYARQSGRRVTFEYALFRDVNDQVEHAEALVRLLKGMRAHVNLIPANEFPGGLYRRSLPQRIQAFKAHLDRAGIACTVRRELGGDIAAACGQLRRKREEL